MILSIISVLFELAVCLGCLVFVGLKTDLLEALSLFKHADRGMIALTAIPFAAVLTVLAFRSDMRRQAGFLKRLAINLGSLRGLFHFGAIGADRRRLKLMPDLPEKGTVLVRGRMVSAAALALISVFAGVWEHETAGVYFAPVMLILSAFAILTLFGNWRKPVAIYARLIGCRIEDGRRMAPVMVISDLALTVLAILIMASGWLILADALAIPLFYSEALLVQILVLWAIMLPLAPFGIGPREMVIFLVFERLGIFGGYALVYAVFSLLILLFFVIAGELIQLGLRAFAHR